MKKLVLALMVLMVAGSIYGQADPNMWLRYVPLNRGALNLTYVAKGTETAATYNIWADSATLTVVDGFCPGTTYYVFADADYDTLTEWIAQLNSRPISKSLDTPCFEGDWEAALVNGCYGGQTTTSLDTVMIASNCFNTAATPLIASASMLYVSYTKPAITTRYYAVDYFIANYVFAGTCVVQLFDSDGTAVGPSMTMTSTVDKVCPQNMRGNYVAMTGFGKGLEIRVTATTNPLTDGYLTIEGTTK